MKNKQKALVLYSGGLDSRLAVKILQEKNYEIEAMHFILPFGCGCCNLQCNFKFTQLQGVKLILMNATKNPLLKEYIKLVKNPKYSHGKGINPCIDCKIWMFKHAKKYADKHKIKIIASGEVLGQRPMSQTGRAMSIIDKELGFEITRPLVKLGIKGRSRKIQMELAKKYKITYPSPAGGCLLCEKALSNRFKILLDNNLVKEKTLQITKIGRHFFIPGKKEWFIVARNEKESNIIEALPKKQILESDKGTPAVYFYKTTKKSKQFAQQLQNAYKQKNVKEFERWKI